jgi:hypothetical protein
MIKYYIGLYYMEEYICKKCSYVTNRKENYKRHLKSKLHIKITKEKTDKKNFTCDNCFSKFTTNFSLQRHNEKCIKMENNTNSTKYIDNETEKIIEGFGKKTRLVIENLILKEKIKHLTENKEEVLKSKEELSKTKDKHIEYLQQTNIENSRMSHISQLSAINFASMYYNKSIGMIGVDKKAQKIDKGIRQLPDMKIWIKESPELADQYVAEKLIVLYNNDKFIDYICSVIHNAYKTEDPLDQTIWSTDVSRLVYIVRITLEKENKWEYDKKGVRIKQSIIDPLLDEVQDIMVEYVEKIHTLSKSNAKIDYLKKLELVNIAKTIIHELKNRLSIKNRIIKALAPMFFLERSVKQIEYKYPEELEVQLVKKKK